MCYWVFWGGLVPYGYPGGRAGGAAGVYTLGGGAVVCTGYGGGAGAGVFWVITLGYDRGFYLESGWVLMSGVEYGRGVG